MKIKRIFFLGILFDSFLISRPNNMLDNNLSSLHKGLLELKKHIKKVPDEEKEKKKDQLYITIDDRIDWDRYLTFPATPSSFGVPKKFAGIKARQAATDDIPKVVDENVRLVDGELKTEEACIEEVAQQAKKITADILERSKKVTSIDSDLREQILKAATLLIEITPPQEADAVTQDILTIMEQAQLEPYLFFKVVLDGLLSLPVMKLYQDVQREGEEQLKDQIGLGRSLKVVKRKEHLEILARKLRKAISRIQISLNLYNRIKDRESIWQIDKDLFLAGIYCNWKTIETLTNQLKSILGDADFNQLFAKETIGPNEFKGTLQKFYDTTHGHMEYTIQNHDGPLINLLDLLKTLYMTNAKDYARIFDYYIPKVVDSTDFTLKSKRASELYRVGQVAAFQAFLHCNFEHFNTEKKLKDTLVLLEAIKEKISYQKDKIDDLKKAITNYTQTRIKKEEKKDALDEIKKKLDKPDTVSVQKVDEIIEKIEKDSDLPPDEKKEITKPLKKRKEIIEQATSIAEKFTKILCDFCAGESRPVLAEKITKIIFNNKNYLNPRIHEVRLKGEEKEEAQKAILESVVAILITKLYKQNVICPICSYRAAYIIAETVGKTDNPYISVLQGELYDYLEKTFRKTFDLFFV